MIKYEIIFILIITINFVVFIHNNILFSEKNLKKYNNEDLNYTLDDINYNLNLSNNFEYFDDKSIYPLNNSISYNVRINSYFDYSKNKTNKNDLIFNRKNNSYKTTKHERILEESENHEYLPIMYICTLSNDSPEFICDDKTSCNNNGHCYNKTFCICDPFYTTYYNKDLMKNNFTQCNYLQLSLKSVFSLSFFLGPLSFDHLLMGNITTGIIKLVLPMIFTLIGNSVFALGKFKDSYNLQIYGKIFELIATLIIIIWWFTDWILLLSGHYKDNRDVDLYNDLY